MAKILVIDDDELVRSTVTAALELAEHKVVQASDGQVTDIIMPEKEGIETIIEIREHDPTIKIIAISGGGRTSNQIFLDVAKKFGAVDVLPKPFTPKQLVIMVQTVLAG